MTDVLIVAACDSVTGARKTKAGNMLPGKVRVLNILADHPDLDALEVGAIFVHEDCTAPMGRYQRERFDRLLESALR